MISRIVMTTPLRVFLVRCLVRLQKEGEDELRVIRRMLPVP